MVAGTVVEALPSRVAAAAADVVDIAKVSAAAKDDSSEQQQPERIALTCGAVVAVVVVVAAAAAVVVAGAKIADHYAGAPFSPVPYFSMFEVAAVPTSPEQDSSTATAAAAQTDRCLPVAPTSPAQHHPSHLEWTENAAAAAAEHSEEQRTVALTADYVVGNSEEVAANAADLATSGYQKHLKIVDPDLDQMNQGSSNLIATDCQNSFHCQHQIADPPLPQHQSLHCAGCSQGHQALNLEFHSGKTDSARKSH